MNPRAGKIAGFFSLRFRVGCLHSFVFFSFYAPIKTAFGIAVDFSYDFPLIDFSRMGNQLIGKRKNICA